MTRFTLISGTGNRFALVDTLRDGEPGDPARLATEVCAPVEFSGLAQRPDGVLLLRRPQRAGDVRMDLFNADGSSAETCGNGLRCIAAYARAQGYVSSASFDIEDYAGLHRADTGQPGGWVTVSMGEPRILARDQALAVMLDGRAHMFVGACVDIGNPHFVVLVEDERRAPVTSAGPALETHAAFPRGTNVEFVAQRAGMWHVRVWERGTGETQACGSGACACAAVLVERGLTRYPVELALPGGQLVVDRRADGALVFAGQVEFHGEREWPARSAAERS